MKRVILSVVGTTAGLVALLSFKSGNHVTLGSALPSAALSPSAGAASTGAPTGAATSPAARSKAKPAPTSAARRVARTKTYDGTAVQTQYGTVQVAVTVAGHKITHVSFLQLSSNDGRSAEINSQAAPLLLQETLVAQSSNINTISGATYTSGGYLQSLQSALDQAGIK